MSHGNVLLKLVLYLLAGKVKILQQRSLNWCTHKNVSTMANVTVKHQFFYGPINTQPLLLPPNVHLNDMNTFSRKSTVLHIELTIVMLMSIKFSHLILVVLQWT